MVQAYNPSTHTTEAGGLPQVQEASMSHSSEFKASLNYSETVSKKQNRKENEKGPAPKLNSSHSVWGEYCCILPEVETFVELFMIQEIMHIIWCIYDNKSKFLEVHILSVGILNFWLYS